jgi:two-component system torCAD operon response regulator TorR
MAARILVLEDDPDQRLMLSDALTLDGHTCVFARTVDEAEHVLASQHIDLALVDMNLPGRTGLEAIQYIRRTPALSHIVTIVVTANHQFQEQAEALGTDLFLIKPVSIMELRTLVQRCLRV